jgi:GNAT superfamily N-acetyltransferase
LLSRGPRAKDPSHDQHRIPSGNDCRSRRFAWRDGRRDRHLQQGFLSPEQIVSSRAVMGLDRQLVVDGTYFVAELDGAIAGCGGWSRRATLYGGDHSAGLREPRLLDPASEPARIRAMYTHPDFARRGVGRALLAHCEAAARDEGFAACELMGTMAGIPLYLASGYKWWRKSSTIAAGRRYR